MRYGNFKFVQINMKHLLYFHLKRITPYYYIKNIAPFSINNSNFQIFSKKYFNISKVLKILWKMEHLLLRNKCSIFIPRHTLVARYYVIPFGVCPSVRPCSPFPIDNLSIYSRNFFKFCIHIVISDEWYGIVNGQNPSIFNGVTALFRIGKMVSGLLFLYCS